MNQFQKSLLLVIFLTVILSVCWMACDVLTEQNKTYRGENWLVNEYLRPNFVKDKYRLEGTILSEGTSSFYYIQWFGGIFVIFYIFFLPLFVIFISGRYQFFNPDYRNYAKSLLIPLVFSIVAILMQWYGIRFSSEVAVYVWVFSSLWYSSTILIVAIVNWIIYLLKRKSVKMERSKV